jgi:hypothetical protein
MNMEILEYHPYLLCYKCLQPIMVVDRQSLRLEQDKTVACPNCAQTLPAEDLYIFTLYREGIEKDFYEWLGFRPWYIQWSADKELIAKFGRHYKQAHGWEPFFSFILAAVASGVIGNAAYDLLKPAVKQLFERQFPHWLYTGINLDYHVQLVFDFLETHEPLDREQQVKKWIVKVQANVDIQSTDEPLSDVAIQAALEEVKGAFQQILRDLETPSSQAEKKNLVNKAADNQPLQPTALSPLHVGVLFRNSLAGYAGAVGQQSINSNKCYRHLFRLYPTIYFSH